MRVATSICIVSMPWDSYASISSWMRAEPSSAAIAQQTLPANT